MTAELRQADKVDDPLIANPATSAIPPAVVRASACLQDEV